MHTDGIDTLPAALAAAAARFGDACAVVDGEQRLSFLALEEAVRAAAGALARHGIAKGDRIALWAPNRLEWIIACLAAQCLGAIAVPLNTRLKGTEAQFILNKTRARLLFTVRGFLGIDYPALLDGLNLPHLERIVTFDGDWAAFVASATPADIALATERRAALTGNDAADIIFTSGTTGLPKGVLCDHEQNVRAFTIWADTVGLRAGDRYLIVNPFFHTFGYKAGWLACLIKGATIYPMATLDVPAMAGLIAREQITVLPGPPTIYQTLLQQGVTANDIPSLRLAVTGAAAIAPALIERMHDELGIDVILSAYGLTESTGLVTATRPGDPPVRIATTSGKAIPGVEVICVDGNGQPVGVGAEGEIWVRGFNVMRGYFEDPAATAEAIDANGWLHTGDVGRLDADGYLQITDRLKDMYISGGFNCYPAEIERLMAVHPAVAQVAIIGVPCERMGEVGKAFVVRRPGMQLDADTLITWCRAQMANYKVPRHIAFMDSLPLNAAGKVQKFSLKDR
ncbi:FadD3 family acyl-CoA ligase [Parapedomonas caeni]